MTFRTVTTLEPTTTPAPLVVDSPHSGRIYPADFDYTCPLHLLRQTEDSYVDELIAGAATLGGTVVMAEFPRSYIDVNRAEDDIDPAVLAEPWPTKLAPSERTRQGLGLVRRMCKSGITVYDAPLSIAAVQHRIETCYRPYYAALENAIGQSMARFRTCTLINCHSMPNQSLENRATKRPDFVLGDRDGTSCDLTLTRCAYDILTELGYSVALNDPYKGMEIVRRYGHPHKGQQALQLEMNRRLYMNEDTLEKHAGFNTLQKNLTTFFSQLMQQQSATSAEPLAAE